MYDASNLTAFTSFHYWFYRMSDGIWKVTQAGDNTLLCYLDEQTNTPFNFQDDVISSDRNAQILEDFTRFKSGRPEYYVGRRYPHPKQFNNSGRIELYETTVVGIALIRARRNGSADPDTAIPKIMKCIEWLRGTDFYIAPASSRYHECYPGGLLYHTLVVMNEIANLKVVSRFNSVNFEDAALVAAVHDWCKIGLYEEYKKNVKNEAGKWEEVSAYRRKDESVPLGHGASSMFIAQKFFSLSIPEALSVRWHMGEYNVADNEMDSLHSANETYPIVQMLQFADRLSIVNYT